jgi:hypothetical protein
MAGEFFPSGSGTGATTFSTIGRRYRRSTSLETFEERIRRSSRLHGSYSSATLAFEGRTMTSRRPAQDHKPTLGDRLISALLCGLWGFATLVFVWVIAFNYVFVPIKGAADVVWTLCTYTTWTAGGVAAALGFILGPERVMDGFGKVWAAIDQWLRGEDR